MPERVTMAYTIGIDFGTESARAVLMDTESGEQVTTAVSRYRHGVLEGSLPDGTSLPQDWALQHPQDWVDSLEELLQQMTRAAQPDRILGIGIDFTSCTLLPTTSEGRPLCLLEEFHARPHAWPMLWKHHAAQKYADRINASGWDLLAYYGGKTSSEWLWAKAWQILEEAPDIFHAADRLIEGGDWIVWQLTGQEVRSICQAGYKAHWQKGRGYPEAAFLAQLHPNLPQVLAKLSLPHPLGSRAGGLVSAWANRTGLLEGTTVATAVIDAHASVPAVGVTEPGVLVAILGTSACHLLLSEKYLAIPGISGVVEDGILPGFYGYEAGQVSFGDIFEWYVRTHAASMYGGEEAAFQKLTREAARLKPGESGLLALDWWNGCRTPYVDASLSGMIIGLTLTTEPPHIYRALLEAAAFGTRRVIETFEAGGLSVEEIRVCGGVAERNKLLLQIMADVTGRDVVDANVLHASATGAAIYAAAAAEIYGSVHEAAKRMGSRKETVYRPIQEHVSVYDALYAEYRRLAEYFGGGTSDVMRKLRQLRVLS
ncbi:MAG: ribulokinase [Armatimonadota bacterium]|nr:ribulokinase [Armatimonadota bacterium]MDR5702575.1 ribulokinase [Armatimonadota bacterium]